MLHFYDGANMDKITHITVGKNIPDSETNFLKTPLYQGFSINENNYYQVFHLEFYNKSIDCFCQECNKESVFQRTNIILPKILIPTGTTDFDISKAIDEEQIIPELVSFPNTINYRIQYLNIPLKVYAFRDHNFTIEFICKRCNSQRLYFFYAIDKLKLIKIGQFPSISDLEMHSIQKYKKLLGEEKSSELLIANRMFAHGLGIGSFVYLRRIFEFLIESAHKEAKLTTNWDDIEYEKSRVEEKILQLKNFFPPFVIESRKVYGVLSKGIHELTEDECKSYFNPMKMIIELILDKRIEHNERIIKEKEAKNGLSKIINELKS